MIVARSTIHAFGTSRLRRFAAVLALATAWFTAPSAATAQQPGQNQFSGTGAGQSEVVSMAKAGTVTLRIASAKGFASANGFIAGSDGIIVTTEHALVGASAVEVRLASGESFVATGLLHTDPALDLALVKIDAAGLPALSLGNSDDVQMGQPLLLISPTASDVTVANGTLNGTQQVRGRKFFRMMVPTSADKSGSPVVITSGRVIGMVVAGLRENATENLSYALPASYIQQILPVVEGRRAMPFATRVPVPQPAVASVTRTAGGDVPDVVNASVGLDYTALDGAELLTEEFKSGEYDRTTRLRYSLSTDVSGRQAIEKDMSTLTRVPNPTATYSKIDYTRLDVRGVTRLDGSKTELYTQQTALSEVARKLAGSLDVTIADTIASLSSSARKPYSVWVPYGVVPSAMRHDALAAMPDSLPEQIFLWTAEVDTSGSRVIPVRFRFGMETTKKIPVAKAGTRCSDDKTKTTKVRVRHVTETTGASTVAYYVLAARPHLRVDEITTRCVRLPARSKSP